MSSIRRLGLLIALLLLAGGAVGASAQTRTGAVGVYYVGPEGPVVQSIRRAAPYVVLVDRVELAQVYVLNNVWVTRGEVDASKIPPGQPVLDAVALQTAGRQVQRENMGLVVFTGAYYPQTNADLRDLLGVAAFSWGINATPAPHVQIGSEADPLQSAIAWHSAPPISARTAITNPNLLRSIVETDAGQPFIQRLRGREGRQVFLVSPWFEDASNAAWSQWPYFDYCIYRLIVEAADAPRILSFAEYPSAPVPQGAVQWVLAGGGAALILLALGGFNAARRALFLNPKLHSAFSVLPPPTPTEQQPGRWAAVGFHRPLAACLLLLGGGVLFFVPWVWYQTRFQPDVLLPWSQTLDFWELVGQGLAVVWALFDVGVGGAAAWYFATLRPQNPREGFRYFQFYLWWQLLSGAVQLGLCAILATLVISETMWAYLSFYFVAHALVQFPGFLSIFGLFFRAIQRLDYEQYTALALTLGTVALQIIAVALLRRWGAAQPGIGAALGAVYGLSLGMLLAQWSAFIIGALLYKRLGYSLRALFWPTFDSYIAGRALSFGLRLTLGSAAIPAAYFVQAFLLRTRLPDYSDFATNWRILLTFLAAYELLAQGLFDPLMPALAETYIHKYRTVAQYYGEQSLRYGMWLSFFLLAVLGGLGPRLLEDFFALRATLLPLFPALLLWGALQGPAGAADCVLVAAGRPGARSLFILGEQVLRLSLLLALFPRLGMGGIAVAYPAARLVWLLAAWSYAGRKALRARLYVWQSVVAPGGAALVLYNVLQGFSASISLPGGAATLYLTLSVAITGLLLYGFLTGFLGGWDDGGLEELRQAVRLSGPGQPVVWPMYQAICLGARISPLHGSFAIDLRPLAHEEAQAMTLRRPPPAN